MIRGNKNLGIAVCHRLIQRLGRWNDWLVDRVYSFPSPFLMSAQLNECCPLKYIEAPLPPAREKFLHAHAVQNRGTGFPGGVFHLAVFHVERISGGRGSVDELLGGLLIVEGKLHPYVLKGVRDLAEKSMVANSARFAISSPTQRTVS